MRHLFIGTALLLVALAVTFGAASMLENLAIARKGPDPEPYSPPTNMARPSNNRPSSGEQARSVNLVYRHPGS